jgi:hypothetical protein
VTTVVNIKKSKYDVYIGRPGKGQDGYFGNPHSIPFCKLCNREHTRGESIAEFKKDFLKRIETDSEYKRRVEELRGKTLGCFCKDKTCHGDVYVEYLEPPKITPKTIDFFG